MKIEEIKKCLLKDEEFMKGIYIYISQEQSKNFRNYVKKSPADEKGEINEM